MFSFLIPIALNQIIYHTKNNTLLQKYMCLVNYAEIDDYWKN